MRQQVRSPLGQMPAYTVDQISADDLEKLVAYIAGLAPEEEHIEPVNVSEILAMHHWMAISAIGSGNERDALHHVEHVAERVKGDHLAAIRRVRALVRQGKVHDAQHLLEQLLAGKAKPDLTPAQINLRLALTAIDQRDRAEARHQVRHYRDRVRGTKRQQADAILAELRRGDFHGADHGISALLGLGHR